MTRTTTGPLTPPASTGDASVALDSGDGSSASFTSLRRVTRSTLTSDVSPVKPWPNLSKYAFTGSSSSGQPAVIPTALNSRPPRSRKASDSLSTPRAKKPRVKAEPITPPRDEKHAPTPKSTSKKPMPQLALDKPHPEPPKWREQYGLIERMRKGIVAPVDDMGCERPRTVTQASPKTLRFHILISLMLSSQTKDAVTSQAVTNLHQTLPGGLTAESLATAPVDMIHECINKVGFWRRKAEYIQDAAKKLLEREGEDKGEVPNTLEGLCELKGVGPKMAFLALQCAWDINAGIGVDVHVHRITNRLRWHKPQTTTPEQTRLNLQSWLPSELHKPINPMMVGFGQVICLPVGPRCDLCLLGQRKICPSRVSNVKAEGRKEVSYTFTAEDEIGTGGAKVEIQYEEVKVKGGVPSGTVPDDEGLIKMEEEDDQRELVKVKVEPGLTAGEQKVLSILDQVDGVQNIGQ